MSVEVFNCLYTARSITNFILQPWHLILAILVGGVHDELKQVIGYFRPRFRYLSCSKAKNIGVLSFG